MNHKLEETESAAEFASGVYSLSRVGLKSHPSIFGEWLAFWGHVYTYLIWSQGSFFLSNREALQWRLKREVRFDEVGSATYNQSKPTHNNDHQTPQIPNLTLFREVARFSMDGK